MVDNKHKRDIIKLSTQKHAGAGAKGVHTISENRELEKKIKEIQDKNAKLERKGELNEEDVDDKRRRKGTHSNHERGTSAGEFGDT